ncbi:MAG TPA: type I phosphomannose isomerase catalytic subunit [Gemmataceae bacterium]|jgi:mannose-6-phosphate isomerase|nr:type I phosphomannose isomerase catalytic subunit [Gemmataceae bacterium]
MEPLTFEPYLRPQVWGGRRLGNQLNKALPSAGTYGEAWELSGHPHHVSRVAEGPFEGTSLNDLCARHGREIFGKSHQGPFPLLIKLLDCHDWLSIQVHPTDAIAEQLRPGELGKTEAWIVLSVEPEGKIFAGLKPGVDRAVLTKHLQAGTTDQCLHAFTPKPGDCIFLPAGTVHAVGGGIVMAEVQQTSDATFRLFDWNRMGADGKPRALHLEESLASINWQAGPVQPVQGKPVTGLPAGATGEHLVSCPFFQLGRLKLAKGAVLPVPKTLSIWMILAGTAELSQSGGAYRRNFRQGETVLIPASAEGCRWSSRDGEATLLDVRVP